MIKMPHPFALPGKLPPDLAQVRDYWEGLKRGENRIPFMDDVNLSALPALHGRLMLVDVFERPQRFRLNMVGNEIRTEYGADVTGKFVDEIEPRDPLSYFAAQASATVERCAPSSYHDSFIRLLLPTWGDGRVKLLLGAVARS